MARFEKLQDLFDLLWRTREPLSLDALCTELRVSPATAKRLIAVLRDNRGLDLRYQRDGNGYVLARGPLDNSVAMLLGLSSVELEGLIEAEALLGKLHPGLLRVRREDDRSRLARVRRRYLTSNGVVDRVHWHTPQSQYISSAVLSTVLEALRRRCRVIFDYDDQVDDAQCKENATDTGERSPVRLMWYPDRIDLVAWCHQRGSLKLFDLSRVGELRLASTPAYLVDPDQVDAWMAQAPTAAVTARRKSHKNRRR